MSTFRIHGMHPMVSAHEMAKIEMSQAIMPQHRDGVSERMLRCHDVRGLGGHSGPSRCFNFNWLTTAKLTDLTEAGAIIGPPGSSRPVTSAAKRFEKRFETMIGFSHSIGFMTASGHHDIQMTDDTHT